MAGMIRIKAVHMTDALASLIAGMVNHAFAVEVSFVEGDRITPDGVRRLADAEGATFFVAYDDAGSAVGTIYAEERAGGSGYFGLLAVAGDRQQLGIGQRLVAHVEEHFRARGCTTVEITVVDRRTELFPYYEKRGYRPDGRTLPFPRSAKVPCRLIYLSKPLGGGAGG